MGQEIPTSQFSNDDFDIFLERLQQETKLLAKWFGDHRFDEGGYRAGFEVEAWLLYKNASPAPVNETYLQMLSSEWVTPELSKFNIELNTEPKTLNNKALSLLEADLQANWLACKKVAAQMGVDVMTIGILPSLQETDLTIENMSKMKRYLALNEQVFAMRQGRPLQLDIVGKERLTTTHYNVMLEASTTSFQVHLQVNPDVAARMYNASVIASAFTVAVAANSPFLFGKSLWEETRIPLFEQAVEVGGYDGAVFGPTRRVGFGSGYVKASLMECFEENYQRYPPMLPIVFDGPAEELHHLRLHNGTIWRWNRPLIGFNEQGKANIRIEHRVISAGPSIVDMIANAAFYYGLVQYLGSMIVAPETQITFVQARDNFYIAARQGLQAQVSWLEDRRINLRELVLAELIPMARAGLKSWQLDSKDIDYYLGIIEARVEKGQHGAFWQRAYAQKHNHDMLDLVSAYMEHQQTGKPVHTWAI